MRVEESGVDKMLGDPLFPGEQLLALEASHATELLLMSVTAFFLRSHGRVEETP
jgi:hypothetical protein